MAPRVPTSNLYERAMILMFEKQHRSYQKIEEIERYFNVPDRGTFHLTEFIPKMIRLCLEMKAFEQTKLNEEELLAFWGICS